MSSYIELSRCLSDDIKIKYKFICIFARLFVPLTCGLRYSRSKKLKILLVFYSLIRTFAEKYRNEKKDLFVSGSHE